MIFRILEIAWLIVGLLAIGMTIFILVTKGVNTEILIYLFIAFIAGILYSFRRKQRIRLDRKSNTDEF